MTTATGTIDPKEAEHFGRMASEWWDPKGSSSMLHQLNPVRLAYIRDRIDQHWGLDECDLKPLKGRRAADVGCGAGLLAEPLARLGAEVTGVDAAPENIAAARVHAEGQGLSIDYCVGSVEALTEGGYDLVTSLEVVEHVSDTHAFVHGLARALKDDGLLILSTPNRTSMSRLMLILIGEGTGRIPRGTHDWEKFLCPDELCALLKDAGLEVVDCTGLAWGPGRGFHISDNKSLDYFVTAKRA
ncbi:MAG: bifunctional 2-polyprenyl-6-hydroxyphenol methylase/3-demethylubiquinol 3-O-methyltransferase UbiG [Alphaproteobacteria bacterium]|nr:MAG: bifunctional 2-polyprenyl-6-hydroxyphenol methylase/3-demethylubiquinol 3-O-methyltransferase UbiG [Alphaproteobacteria bacterium]